MPALTMRSAPSGPKIHVKNYSLFRGVDFSSDPSKVDDRRSPWAPNLISDAGGFPEKRLGWRTVHTFDGPVHGIFFFKNQSGSYQLCHAGSKLWLMGGDAPQLLRSDLHQGRSRAFPMGGKLWILTGGEYLAFDGETVCDASELAYVPVTTVPSSTTERVSYQPVNLLTPKRKNLPWEMLKAMFLLRKKSNMACLSPGRRETMVARYFGSAGVTTVYPSAFRPSMSRAARRPACSAIRSTPISSSLRTPSCRA